LSGCSPLERIKIQLQVQDVLYKGAGHERHRTDRSVLGGLRQIYQREGVMGWFKGNGTNVVRIVPYSSSQVRFDRRRDEWLGA
jgi:solute carrier family 25 (mitochondrial phosphate transporter), member 23/24/25/41